MVPVPVSRNDAVAPVPLRENIPEKQVCWYSFWHILMLDNPIRRFLQDPEKILKGHIRSGMTVIDIGCGPGIFIGAMARMAGESGRVIAIDLQEEMLSHAQERYVKNTSGAPITWHQCRSDSLGIMAEADFALSFYMVHEVPDLARFFREVFRCLKPSGRYLIVEPVFHVSNAAFNRTLDAAKQAGFTVQKHPPLPLSRTVILKKEDCRILDEVIG